MAAGAEHVPGILAIYNHAVEHSTAIWNDVLVDADNRRESWRGRTAAGFPVLVAVADDDLIGYTATARFGLLTATGERWNTPSM